MSYQAVIFDLDGTLLDTIEDIADAVNDALSKFHYPVHDSNTYKLMVGLGMERLIEDALPPEARVPETLQRVLQEAKLAYSNCWNNKSKPYAGIIELLKTLKENNLKIAVLSNKPDRFTRDCVKSMLPVGKIDRIQGAVGTIPHKPSPEGALVLAKAFEVAPANVLYVGDTNTDMETAKAAGMFAVGVSWGFRSTEELLKHGADVIIDKPMELLNYIE